MGNGECFSALACSSCKDGFFGDFGRSAGDIGGEVRRLGKSSLVSLSIYIYIYIFGPWESSGSVSFLEVVILEELWLILIFNKRGKPSFWKA